MKLSAAVLLGFIALLEGCASIEKPDPLEPWNRAVFALNERIDEAVLRPVASVYERVLPAPVQNGVTDFFANSRDLWSATNIVLQGHAKEGGAEFIRFGANTFAGALGVVDVATPLGYSRHDSDFGLTLAHWGVDPGAYIVLPLFGPFTARDAVALPLDLLASPLRLLHTVPLRNTLVVTDLVNTRANMLSATDTIDGIALDKYSFVRDAYLQRRRSRVETLDGDGKEGGGP